MKSETELCQKDCDVEELPQEKVDFTGCIESNDPEHSYGLFCNEKYQKEAETWNR